MCDGAMFVPRQFRSSVLFNVNSRGGRDKVCAFLSRSRISSALLNGGRISTCCWKMKTVKRVPEVSDSSKSIEELPGYNSFLVFELSATDFSQGPIFSESEWSEKS